MPTQYTVTFGGTLGAQDLLPNPGPAFVVTDNGNLLNGGVGSTTTTQGAGLVNATNGASLGTSDVSVVPAALVNGVGSEHSNCNLRGPITGGTFRFRYELKSPRELDQYAGSHLERQPTTLVSNIQAAAECDVHSTAAYSRREGIPPRSGQRLRQSGPVRHLLGWPLAYVDLNDIDLVNVQLDFRRS